MRRSTAVVECPKSMVGRVIGKSGETIKALQSYSGALIQIDQTVDPTKVTISGTPHSLSLAVSMVSDIVKGTFKGFALLRQVSQQASQSRDGGPSGTQQGTLTTYPLAAASSAGAEGPRPVYAPGYGLIPPSQLYGGEDRAAAAVAAYAGGQLGGGGSGADVHNFNWPGGSSSQQAHMMLGLLPSSTGSGVALGGGQPQAYGMADPYLAYYTQQSFAGNPAGQAGAIMFEDPAFYQQMMAAAAAASSQQYAQQHHHQQQQQQLQLQQQQQLEGALAMGGDAAALRVASGRANTVQQTGGLGSRGGGSSRAVAHDWLPGTSGGNVLTSGSSAVSNLLGGGSSGLAAAVAAMDSGAGRIARGGGILGHSLGCNAAGGGGGRVGVAAASGDGGTVSMGSRGGSMTAGSGGAGSMTAGIGGASGGGSPLIGSQGNVVVGQDGQLFLYNPQQDG